MSYNFRPIVLREPAASTPELQKEINKFNESWGERHKLNDEKLLYHYTDTGGLQGIIESQQLWFSHINTLNDPNELKYGKNVVLSEINKREAEIDDADFSAFCNSIKNTISGFGITLHHAFITCFCEKENLLSQWRGYSEFGGGYCLGFNFNESTKIFFDENNGNVPTIENLTSQQQPLLRKIIYDADLQIEIVNGCLDRLVEGYRKGLPGKISRLLKNKNYHSALMGSQGIDPLLDLAISFKHPAFKEEDEWRFINIVMDNYDPENFSFRSNSRLLVPYRKTYVSNINKESIFPLKSITIGPSLDHAVAKTSIKLLLNKAAKVSKHIKIIPSEININESGYKLR